MNPTTHCSYGALSTELPRIESCREPERATLMSEAVDNPLSLISRLRDDDSPLPEVRFHPGISEVSSVLCCGDGGSSGIERFQLEFLLRTVIYLDRLDRSA